MDVKAYRLLATIVVPQIVRCLIVDAVNRATPVLMQARIIHDAIGCCIRFGSGISDTAWRESRSHERSGVPRNFKETSKDEEQVICDMVLEFPQLTPS
jgi:hypothetical protein